MVTQVQHEAEHNRRHARYRLPATLVINGTPLSLSEWSVSGLSARGVPASIGEIKVHHGKLVFDLGGFALSTDVEIEIIRFEADDGAMGARFVNFTRQNLSLLHYIINAYLAGEIITAGDVISVASRDLFGKKDLDKRLDADETQTTRLLHAVQRFAGNSVLFVVLIGLLAFVAYTLYGRWFVIESLSARVTGPVLQLRAPDDGYLELTEAGRAEDVETGALLGVIKRVDGGAGSLESPCDCRLLLTASADGVFVGRGEPVFTLLPVGARLHVEARVAFRDLERVEIGDPATMRLVDGMAVSGKVVNVRADAANHAETLVIIEPTDALSSAALDAVATVRINTFGS